MKTKAVALQISESIDIRGCKDYFKQKLLFSDRDELFYDFENQKHVYIFRYGVICFYNLTSSEINEFKNRLYPFTANNKFVDESLMESIEIYTGAKVFSINFKEIHIIDSNTEKLRLIMLNTSQSVALDYYAVIIERLLEDTRQHTTFLEEKGRLDIGGKKLKRYIGKVLNVKNKISENLYIFDSPDATWEDETLNILNNSLKKEFDLKDRYQTITQQVNIVKDNLELFKDIMFHKESSKLEWIIIILIVIEVIDLLILKIINEL